MPTPDPCAACSGTGLEPHFRVSGETGEQGLIPTTDRFGVALADIVRCRECGHMQLEQLPSESDLADSYRAAESLAYVAEEAGQRATARANLVAIERHVPPGRLVDLGCWVGFLLAEARERGWHAVGVEPSEFASAYAREQLGLDVSTADLLTAELGREAFSAVVLADVIEHLPSPAAALERAGDLLDPAGVLAIALPDAGSRLARTMGARWWSILPTHLHYFTRHSIGRLLGRCGFEVLEANSAPKTFSIGYYLGRLSGYSPVLGERLTAAAQRLGLAERLWTPDFRDRMLVLARRR